MMILVLLLYYVVLAILFVPVEICQQVWMRVGDTVLNPMVMALWGQAE